MASTRAPTSRPSSGRSPRGDLGAFDLLDAREGAADALGASSCRRGPDRVSLETRDATPTLTPMPTPS